MEPYSVRLKHNSRKLRSNMTDVEQILWSKLRRKQLLGMQFYRQKPILNYIVDFYCPKAKLVIELDGGQHYEPTHQKQDKRRDDELASLGLTVMRFDNLEILSNLDGVLSVIYDYLDRKIPPSPPFSKGGTIKSPLFQRRE